jgi:hypothetical protein
VLGSFIINQARGTGNAVLCLDFEPRHTKSPEGAMLILPVK